jgi:formate dehydrogenase subunit gamma
MTAQSLEPGSPVHPGDPVTVDRYTPAARINHWITAASLVLLAVSGLALFHPKLYFLTGLFGGGTIVRIIHPWIGVVLFFGFLGLFLRFWKANLWSREDGTWMARLRDVLAAHDENLPEIGKYNAGQKIVFWMMSLLIVVLILSGLVLWDQYFFDYTTIGQKRISVLIHALAAIVIICTGSSCLRRSGCVARFRPWCAAPSPVAGPGVTIANGLGNWLAARVEVEAQERSPPNRPCFLFATWPVWFVRLSNGEGWHAEA